MPKIARAFICLLRRSLFPTSLLLNIATLCVDCWFIANIFFSFLSFLGGIPLDYGYACDLLVLENTLPL